ncbi:MAG TPA: tRNA nucleotidyltransferase [Bacteroidetes bacterium]|nr:MAG: HD domain-containing protein [Rhodothermaceae bacterium TMED105]HBD42965.1 tRNA nucleotidyltransferase [Bacteroidota bacterium]|tara:strand:+ start:6277 stop:7719 length:1443 start_codon:yes stop_codon:yes gene_type:complete
MSIIDACWRDLPAKHHSLFEIVREAGKALDQPVFVVGGYVRDALMPGRQSPLTEDIDFVTLGPGDKLAQEVAKRLNLPASSLSIFKNFGTAHLHTEGMDLEFVGARKESYQRHSRKPVVEAGTLEEDQERRDLTINAMSFSLNEEDYGALRDPFHGLEDLQNGIIRTPIDPQKTFDDDPLRMMRAIRFAVRFGFEIEESTYQGIVDRHERLGIISAERIAEELNKMILSDKPSYAFALLVETGLLSIFFPEMVALQGVKEVNGIRHKDNFWHTLEVLDNVAELSDDLWLRWAAIMHDIAKPPTQRFVQGVGWTFHGHEALGAKWVPKLFRRLSLPLDGRMKSVQTLVRLHLRPIALADEGVTDSAVRRLIYEAGDDLEHLMLLCRADVTSKNDTKVKQYLANFDQVDKKIVEVEQKDRVRNWKNPVTGEMIMEACGVPAGPVVGELKEAVKEAIMDGVIENDPEQAKVFMMEEAKRRGVC